MGDRQITAAQTPYPANYLFQQPFAQGRQILQRRGGGNITGRGGERRCRSHASWQWQVLGFSPLYDRLGHQWSVGGQP